MRYSILCNNSIKMKALKMFIGAIVGMAAQGFALAGICWVLHFVFYFIGFAETTPTGKRFLWGWLIFFVLFFALGIAKTASTIYHMWKEPLYKMLYMSTGLSWEKYKELYLSDSIKTDDGSRIPIRKIDKSEREATAAFFQMLKDVRGNGGLMEELKDVAFEVLILHYGVDKKGWINILCSQYKTEVADVYGPDDRAARNGLSELWTTTYNDRYSGISRTFEEWSKAFATEMDVQNYYEQGKR